MSDADLLAKVDSQFIGTVSPTAPRIQAGGHPCQGIYWTPKGTRPKTALIATHYNVDFTEHYIAPHFAARGVGFLGWNTRYRGAEDQFLLEHALIDIGVGVRWLKEKAGVENVKFLKGEIENIPLPDNSVDVIISNCVINLSADKDRVLREAFRVLKPGGRFAVSDVVTRGEMLPEIRNSVLLWVGCIAGALEENEYLAKLAAAGFELLPGETPIIPVMLHDARRAQAMAQALDERGVYVAGFFFPVVPKGQARIRTQMSAALREQDVTFAIDAFKDAGKALGLI